MAASYPPIARVRGAVCVFPPGLEKPVWIPERCVRHVDLEMDATCSTAPISDGNNHIGNAEEGSMGADII